MLKMTYLGWQGWMARSEKACLLIDPLLLDEIGRGPYEAGSEYHFWPPRVFDLGRLPQVTAVILTHEHEDHFNIPTLSRIDRSIPIYLSSRSSVAGRTILAEMGFEVRLLRSGETIAFEDLLFSSYGPDLADAEGNDEFDVAAFLIRHAGGDGNFFTNVDIAVTSEMLADLDFLSQDPLLGLVETLCFKHMLAFSYRPGALERKSGDFCLDGSALERIQDGEPIRPVPGQTFLLSQGKLQAVQAQAEFLRAQDSELWGPKPSFWPKPGEEIAPPACGQRLLKPGALDQVETGLSDLAGFIFGRRLFRLLYSVNEADLGETIPSFVLRLLNGEGEEALIYEYQPQLCAFKRVRDLPRRHLGAVTLWAADFAALVDGAFGPRAIVKSLREEWREPLKDYSFLMEILWSFFHPLRDPQPCLRQYRRKAREESGAVPFVRPIARPALEPVAGI